MLKIKIYKESIKGTGKGLELLQTLLVPIDTSEIDMVTFALDKLCRSLTGAGVVFANPEVPDLPELVADRENDEIQRDAEDELANLDEEFGRALRTCFHFLRVNMP